MRNKYFLIGSQLAVISMALLASTAVAQVLQTNQTIPWIPGVTVGVRGGIPVRTNLIDVTKAPYNANNLGTSNATAAIQAAINAAASNDVIYLPNGTYVLDTTLNVNKSHITLRGQSRDGVFLLRTNSNNGIVSIGGAGLSPGTVVPIQSGFMRGSTNVAISDSSSLGSVGDVVGFSMLNPVHPSFKVISVAGFERLVSQRAVITGKSATNITFSPPLIFDFTNSPGVFSVGRATLNPMFASRNRVGVENLTITQTNRANGMKGSSINMLTINNAADCWVVGVRIEWPRNYAVAISEAAHCYFGSNDVANSQNEVRSSNNAGLLTSSCSGNLFENNVFANRLFPAIEFNNGFSGNALFGNVFWNNFMDVDCHNSHPLMNLWEANDLQNFEMDGYFGSASHQVLWRNAVRGVWLPLMFKRWTTYMQVVGNVLGNPSASYLSYAADVNGSGGNIIEMGRPNIGNNTYVGMSPPIPWNYPGLCDICKTEGGFTFTNNQVNTTNLVGNFSYVPAPVATIYALQIRDGSNTNRYFTSISGGVLVASAAGTSTNLLVNTPVTVKPGDTLFVTGQTAYQQLQKTDRDTYVIAGNYDYFHKGIDFPANRAIETSVLYPNGAPSWWGSNRWPAFGSDLSPLSVTLPAAQRIGLLRPAAPGGLRRLSD